MDDTEEVLEQCEECLRLFMKQPLTDSEMDYVASVYDMVLQALASKGY